MIIQENYLITEEKQCILIICKYFLASLKPQSEVSKCDRVKKIQTLNLAKGH